MSPASSALTLLFAAAALGEIIALKTAIHVSRFGFAIGSMQTGACNVARRRLTTQSRSQFYSRLISKKICRRCAKPNSFR
jgi:hypothetical protein